MTLDQKQMLDPYANEYAELYNRIGVLDTPYLTALLAACLAASWTNCWVMTYRAAQILIPIIRQVLSERAPQTSA